jgi:hypothetical protein
MRALGWLSLVALLVALLEGCSPGAPPKGVPARALDAASAPTAASSEREHARIPSSVPTPWDLESQLSTLRPVTPRVASEHLGGAFDGEVLANEAAKPYPALGPKLALAPGATLVERHVARGVDATTVYFAMVKRSPGYDPERGDWEYLVVTADGRIEERGRLPLCGRCHADAPHDHLFGAGR